MPLLWGGGKLNESFSLFSLQAAHVDTSWSSFKIVQEGRFHSGYSKMTSKITARFTAKEKTL